MARIVITTWGSFGDLNPYLGLATALRARGHHPVMAMPAVYAPAIAAAGLEHAITEPDADPALDPELVKRVLHPRNGAESIFREVLLPVLAESHASLLRACEGADFLVGHPAAVTAPIVAEQLALPWVSTVLSPLLFMSGFDPIVPPPAPWVRVVPWAWRLKTAPWIADAGRQISNRWMEPLQQFRESLGLRRVVTPMFEGQHSPHGVLAMFSRVFGGPFADWPPHTTITGQLQFDASYGATLDPALARFLDGGEPPVVFTLGSSAVMIAERFWDESLAAVRRLGRRAVLLAGPAQAPRLTALAPASVHVVSEAPHSLLFPRAAAVVHQCGMGTLGTALHAGVPQLAVPFANDQPDNADRLQRLGVARVVYPSRYRAGRVARTLRALFDEPTYTRRAQALATVVAAERGAEAACDAIEQALDRAARSAAPVTASGAATPPR
jgi:UDP:flavonoid glycosyltransferase YjiC (YdhE family)